MKFHWLVSKQFRPKFAWFFISLLVCLVVDQASLTSEQKRGKLIYEEGRSTQGPQIMAVVEEAELNAAALPCVNCHGQRGIGNPEGGVTPANLQWSYLTNPYAIEFANGRKRKAYNQSTLSRAIANGIDPSDNHLHVAMPRYKMSETQMNDLIAYLKVIHQYMEPGVYQDRLHIGVILAQENGEAVQDILSAYFSWINSKGGIYNRQIIPYFYAEGHDSTLPIEEFITKNVIFAFVASSLSNTETIVPYLQSKGIPVIGALSGSPSTGEIDDPFYFLFPDASLLATDLILYLENISDTKPIITLYETGAPSEGIVRFIKDQLGDKSLSKFQFTPLRKILQLENGIPNNSNEIIINLLPLHQLQEVIETGQLSSSNSTIYIPGYLLGDEIFEIAKLEKTQLIITLPSWKTVHKISAVKSYQNLLAAYQLTSRYPTAQYHALAAGQLLNELLKRTGKEISRLEVIEEIEKIVAFDTGFMPPITYSPVDKIGSNRIYVISPDAEKMTFELVHTRKLNVPPSR